MRRSTMRTIFIIEHLEKEVYPWCLIEYKHISRLVGKEKVWFTNLRGVRGERALRKYGACRDASARELKLVNACVLDPAAQKTLTPKEAPHFSSFIFGGILGDDPPKERTKAELTPFLKNAVVRNLGKEQMATDNAVAVVQEIARGKLLKKLKFQESIEIKFNNVESVQLPYRYLLVKGKPLYSTELVRYLKRKRGF